MLFSLFNWNVTWEGVTYKLGGLRGKGLSWNKTSVELKDGKGVPGIVSFETKIENEQVIEADQTINTWLSFLTDGQISLSIKEFRLAFDATLKINDKGQLKPNLSNIHISFGSSSIARTNWFTNALTWMWVEYSKRMIENTAFFFNDAFGEFLY